ncbi:uncharacterized protein [Amphiura filiformis]|uniref:uncharacterized protein n=1 Tax=Amphiura filiformis TaxID=82378 RepID=UPI003B216C66
MLRPLLFLTALCGTLSTSYTGTTSEKPWGPTNEESTHVDDVDTKTAIVTEVIDEIQKVTATGQSYPDFSDVVERNDEVENPTFLPDEINHVTAKSTTDPDVKPTTSHTKQIVQPVKNSSNRTSTTNTTLPDSSSESNSGHVTEYTQQNTTHILQTLRRQRTDNSSNDEKKLNTTNKVGNVTINNLTSEFVRIPNSSLASSTSFQVDTTTSSINTSTVKAPGDKSSLFLLDSTSPTSLPTTVGSEPTTALDDSGEYTSPRPSINVEDTLEASRIDMNVNRAMQRRKNINHAALWITIGFVVVLVSYIAVLVIYNRNRPEWQPSLQEYQRFEEEAPEVSTATTGCTTSDEDNISNHSTDAMTQTHPFLETVGCSDDREITGYYSDSEQLYRQ